MSKEIFNKDSCPGCDLDPGGTAVSRPAAGA